MSERKQQIQKALAREDEEFRTWARQHTEFEQRLAQLADKMTLSAEEEFEEKELKKRKLWLKDHMAAKIREYQVSRV
ncbi:MAG: DUF465 domain-containing protein [Thermoanaerobaculia bacterium]